MALPIRFLDATKRIEGKEFRSKLLHPDSALYKWLTKTRKNLCDTLPHISEQRMDFHIELIPKSELKETEVTAELLVKRAQQLEGQMCNILSAQLVGKTFQLPTPDIDIDHIPGHITIVHFSEPPEEKLPAIIFIF